MLFVPHLLPTIFCPSFLSFFSAPRFFCPDTLRRCGALKEHTLSNPRCGLTGIHIVDAVVCVPTFSFEEPDPCLAYYRLDPAQRHVVVEVGFLNAAKSANVALQTT